jgi:serine protease Do
MHSIPMKAGVVLWFSCVMALLGGCDESSLERLEQDIASVVQEAGPSVVCIVGKNQASGEAKFGSGVILDVNHILTTENILNNVDDITIRLQDGTVIGDQEIVGIFCDFETNVSLIEVSSKMLAAAPIMEQGRVDNGCLGIALGNTNYSKGLDVSLGTVTKSWIGGADAYDESLLIWHGPAAPYRGGTPIFNRNGELVGLTEGRAEGEEGVVFILPASTCARVSDVLKRDGKVRRGWIGVFCEKPFGKCEKGEPPKGVTIDSVAGDSPASRAGLGRGDRILGFNGKRIDSAAELRRLVSATEAGFHVLLTVVQGREEKTADIVVQTRETEGQGMRRCPHRSI